MGNLIKRFGRVGLSFLAGAGLGAAFLFSVEALSPKTVQARTVCSKDYLGRTVCRTDGGATMTGSKDYLGRDVWRGSDGSRTTCSTDYLGRYVCN